MNDRPPTGPPPLPPDHAVNYARAEAAGDLDPHLRVVAVNPQRRLANAVLWGDLSAELIASINLDWIGDVWCRSVIAAVMVLREEGRDATLAAVHEILQEYEVHRGPDEIWFLAMADVTAADGRLDEDHATIYLEQIRTEHLRRAGRQALIDAAHKLETSADPAQVLADLADDLGAT